MAEKQGQPDKGTEKAAGPERAAPPSVQELIAQRRAKLSAETASRKAGGDGVSLQDVLQQKAAKAEPSAGEEAPDGTPGGAPAGGEAFDGATVPADAQAFSLAGGPFGPVQAAPARQPLTQAMLVLNTFLLAAVGGVLLYLIARRPESPSAAEGAVKAVRAVREEQDGRAGSPQTRPAADANATANVAAALAAPSWAAAEAAYAKKDYDAALDRFSRLLLVSRRLPSEAPAGEFFQYRIGRCLWELGRLNQAREVLGRLQDSDTAAIRAAAGADLAVMDESGEQHLLARLSACGALAALAATEISSPLEADCDYLVARSLTEKVRSFHSSEPRVPWSRRDATDLFAGRSETEVRRLLEARILPGGPAQRGPVVAVRKTAEGWYLYARKAAIEDVLHQFATKAGRDLRWESVPPAVRRRPVSFTFRDVSEQRAFELACGAAGLLGRFTWDQVVVHDPQSLTSLSALKLVLTEEAISAWRRFPLRHGGDERVAEGQFALAVLYENSGDAVAAMKQYQLVGRQYPKSHELAPEALIRSAELRIQQLRDLAGARADLQDALDLHPNYRRIDRVYLMLGRFSAQSGQLEEAMTALLKLQTLDVPAESRRLACLELGDCCFRRGDYEQASQWLSRYLVAGKEAPERELVRAYLLLGRSEAARGNRAAAAAAFRRALAAKPLRDEYVEAVLDLTGILTDSEDYTAALATARRVETEPLSDTQRHRYLMAVSGLYRAMGLPDRGRAFLRKGGEVLTDGPMRASIAAEQARCLREEGDLRAARDVLWEVLGRLKGGPGAREASIDLAEICMEMDDAEQAVVLAREALKGSCPPATRRRGLEVLGRAYLRRRDYTQAARTLASLGAEAKTPQAPKPDAGGEGK